MKFTKKNVEQLMKDYREFELRCIHIRRQFRIGEGFGYDEDTIMWSAVGDYVCGEVWFAEEGGYVYPPRVIAEFPVSWLSKSDKSIQKILDETQKEK